MEGNEYSSRRLERGETIPQSDEGRKTEVGSSPERYIYSWEMKEEKQSKKELR